MKYRRNKILFSILSLVLTFSMSSCVDDLNVDPIDPSKIQTFEQDKVFTKIYASMGLTGQEGPAGNGDVKGIDEGFSDFYRLIWNLNELTTDEAICAWSGDTEITPLNFNSWSPGNGFIAGMYGRFYFNITLCNHFLEQTTALTDDKTKKQRAEARFIRAMNYYYLLDMFGNVPFSEVVTMGYAAPQIKRLDLFKYVEKELSECEADMYEPHEAPYYRIDKVANWLIRSRLYLNAEVYTTVPESAATNNFPAIAAAAGTPHWNDAAIYAKKVIDTYPLCPVYKHLFMGDNAGKIDGSDANKAPQEIILPIAADGIKTQGWGGSLFLIASTHASDMAIWGSSAGWEGNRARASLVKKFFPTAPTIFATNKADLTTAVGAIKDNRALLNGSTSRTLDIADYGKFKQGYSIIKFSNVRVDGLPSHAAEKTDMDIPFLRSAEAYLTYAEAVLHGGAVIDAYPALTAFNALRIRANASQKTSIDLPMILDERAREFMFEGHRRSDLIRFGKYGGATGYTWDWKGGEAAGKDFKAEFNLFPIPTTDLNANPNLDQNPGY